MSKDTDKSLFMVHPSLVEYGGFYQGLLRGVSNYEQLGNRLIQLGEQAHAFRQFDKVKEIGRLLSHIPVKNYQSIGYYFLAVAANSKGNGDQDTARKLYEIVASTAPSRYKAKAILSLAAVSFNTRDFETSFYYYKEAIKAGQLSIVSVQAIRGMALLKSVDGSHAHALKDLESLLPMVKYMPAYIYFDYLNSYAVELGEAGRKEEARNISRIVLASPFIHAYPEWRETAEDLREPSRSSVAIEPTRNGPHNVVSMPVVEYVKSERISYNPPARVTNLQQWKTKMGKDEKPTEDLTPLQIINRIVLFYTNKNTTDYQRYKIWEAVAKIMYQPDPPKPDDTEGA